MWIFRNFISVTILVGILTRIAKYFYQKDLKKTTAAYLTFFTVGVVIFPIAAFLVGFDIAASEYVIALIMWLIFDLIRADAKKRRSE